MPAIVLPGICHYSVEGLINGRPWVNILDMLLDPAILDSRHDVIIEQAQIIFDEYGDAWQALLGADWSLQRVSWVDYHTADGEVGFVNSGNARPGPYSGAAPGETLSAQVAVLYTKATTGGRSSRKGRMYVAGVTENSADGNGVDGAVATAWSSAGPSFLTAINQTGGQILDFESFLHVVHAPFGLPASSTRVTSLTREPVFATQRRRLRG